MKRNTFLSLLFLFVFQFSSNAQTYFNMRIQRVSFSTFDFSTIAFYSAHPFDVYQQNKSLSSINNSYVAKDSIGISPNAVTHLKAYTRYKKYKNASYYSEPNQLVCYETDLYNKYYYNINFDTQANRLYNRYYPKHNIFFESRYTTTDPNLILIRK